MKKRPWTVAVVVMLLVGVAVAVFYWSGRTTEDRVTMRMIGEAYAPLEALAEMVPEYEKESGTNVEIVRKDHQAVITELDQEFTADRVTYDLILMPHRLVGRLVEQGHVQPLDGYLAAARQDGRLPKDLEDDLFPKWWREISWYDGKVYGFPFTCLSMYVVYRDDLMSDPAEQEAFSKQYGHALAPPKSWDEYVQVAEFFTRPDEGLYGTYINGQNHPALWYEWLNYIYSFGGNILDTEHGSDYGDIVVNSPENVEATEFFVSLLKYSPPEAPNYNWDDTLTAVQQGRVFMGLTWQDAVPYIEDPAQSRVAGKVKYALIPKVGADTGVAQLEGWTYLIPTESKHPQEAFDFILWAMGRERQVTMTLKGGTSARSSVYDNQQVRALPYMETFLACVPIAVPKPTVPESSQMTEIIQQELARVVAGDQSAREALDRAAVKLKELLGDRCQLRYPTE